jgi:hypothetical protein
MNNKNSDDVTQELKPDVDARLNELKDLMVKGLQISLKIKGSEACFHDDSCQRMQQALLIIKELARHQPEQQEVAEGMPLNILAWKYKNMQMWTSKINITKPNAIKYTRATKAISESDIISIALETGFMISTQYGQEENQPMPVSDKATLLRFAKALQALTTKGEG